MKLRDPTKKGNTICFVFSSVAFTYDLPLFSLYGVLFHIGRGHFMVTPPEIWIGFDMLLACFGFWGEWMILRNTRRAKRNDNTKCTESTRKFNLNHMAIILLQFLHFGHFQESRNFSFRVFGKKRDFSVC